MIDKGQLRTLKYWMTSLPEHDLLNNNWLCYWQGITEIPVNPVRSKNYFQRAYQLSKENKDERAQVLSWCGAVNTYSYAGVEFKSLDEWIADLPYLKQLARNLCDAVLQERVEYAVYLALMYRQPDHAEMQDYENRVWNMVMHGNNTQVRIQAASQLLLFLTRWRGEFDKAEILVNAMQPIMDKLSTRPLIKITWHVMLSIYYGAIFRANECRENIQAGIDLSDQTGIYNWKPMLNLQACFLTMHSGKTKEATYYIDQLKHINQPERLYELAIYYFYRAWYELHDGYNEAVKNNILLALKFARLAGNSIIEITIETGYAQFLLQQGDVANGLKLIGINRKKAKKINARNLVFQTYMAQAYYALKTDNLKACLKLLPSLFNKNQIFSASWWRDSDFSKLCALALQNDIETESVVEVIARHKLLPPSNLYETDQWPFPVKIQTLGRFRLMIGNRVEESTSKVQKKPLELLKALIAFGAKEVRDELLTEALWPESEGDAAYDSLRTTVRRLRTLLNEKETVSFSQGKLSLNPDYCWVDSWYFERLAGLKDAEQPQLEKALELYQGRFLACEEEYPWISSMRDRLGQKYIKLTTDLAHQYEIKQQWQQAIDIYQQGLVKEEIVEVFYQGMIRCHINMGQQVAAKQAYQQCEKMLYQKLNSTPSKHTLDLVSKLVS